jgi:putative hydrolase
VTEDVSVDNPDPAQVPGPVEALREIGFWLERARAETHRVKAYRRAAEVLAGLPDAEREVHRAAHSWRELAGIGPKTAAVIEQAYSGAVPDYLIDLRTAARPIGAPGKPLRALLRGDLHTHSNWSDGGSPIEEMMGVAAALGHEYCALTDHSPRLTVANGLSADRLRSQLDIVAELNDRMAPFRILTGIEVDILDDGALDQEDELLARLDVVVASVHSKLRMEAPAMTRRMVAAVRNPHVDILGHCTGRLVQGGPRGAGRGRSDKRPESEFDAEAVFGACLESDTAVEINSRPERLDPPLRLLRMVVGRGCKVSIDTDAHAPGQLEWQANGCSRAAACDVPLESIVNTGDVGALTAWTASHS